VKVTVGGVPVKTLKAGAFFGEVGLMSKGALGNAAAAPSATVTAEAARTTTLALGRSAFRRLLGEAQLEALSAHIAAYHFQTKRPDGILAPAGGGMAVVGRPTSAPSGKTPGRLSVHSLSMTSLKLAPTKPRIVLRPGARGERTLHRSRPLTPPPSQLQAKDLVLLKELGSGMTGHVFLCRANVAGGGSTLVVVKVMCKAKLVYMKQVENVQKEKEMLASWDCAHIVQSLGCATPLHGRSLFYLTRSQRWQIRPVSTFFWSSCAAATSSSCSWIRASCLSPTGASSPPRCSWR